MYLNDPTVYLFIEIGYTPNIGYSNKNFKSSNNVINEDNKKHLYA